MSYRQFVPDGPHIPYDLVHALEDGRLVFFCGAGISIATGLPSFRGLVDGVLTRFAYPRAEEGVPRDPVLAAAYKREEYDKVLDILEDREGASGDLRRYVCKRLTARPTGDLDFHTALLELSRVKGGPADVGRGYRLVTTNFDNRFQLAGARLPQIEAAPLISRPRPDRFRRLVYLHGRIDMKHDPDGRSLILTSTDFGNAISATASLLASYSSFSVVTRSLS